MKNASLLKSKPETPKTPGGISKSLLTPCRRVGLSRNWRKSIASPFNSPLASTESEQDNIETRKRKESLEETPQMTENIDSAELSENVGTPTRKMEMPRRKKSKTLLHSIIKTAEDGSQPQSPNPEKTEEECVAGNEIKEFVIKSVEAGAPKVVSVGDSTPVRLKSECKENAKVNADDNNVMPEVVSTPLRLKSKSKSKKNISPKIYSRVKETDTNPISTNAIKEVMDIKTEHLENSNKLIENKLTQKTNITDTEKENLDNIESKNKDRKVKSPNNLTKECVVVIQKKIFKKELKANELLDKNKQNTVSQALFNDSDSDEVPLNCLNKTENINNIVETITIDDDDFTTSKPKAKKPAPKSANEKTFPKVKTTSKSSSKDTKTVNVQEHKTLSQSSIDDDDFFEKKRTIIVRKSYDKVIKPLKAKSTGSITQKDIEDLKARIETKKKMLLAQSMTDTKELRELIKKWQKGCQDALMELMDLMKNKCPDQNMEYSQILRTLKIPATLVGYDSDNDCFVTPDDENIILSHIKE